MTLGKEPRLTARGWVGWASGVFSLSGWLGDTRVAVLFWVAWPNFANKHIHVAWDILTLQNYL